MNKKQLIVVWVVGIIMAFLLFFGLGKRVIPYLYLLTDKRPYWMPTVWSILSLVLIIGGLLIYTLGGKKKSMGGEITDKKKIKRIIAREGIELAIIMGILLISFSIFYHFIIYIPKIEGEKFREKIRQKTLEAEIRKSCMKRINLVVQGMMEKGLADGVDMRFITEQKEMTYRECLRENGIEK